LQVTRFLPVKNRTTRSKTLDRVRAMLIDPQRQQVTMVLLQRPASSSNPLSIVAASCASTRELRV
jgi:hypothetical protein